MNGINDSHISGGEADVLWCLGSYITGHAAGSLHAMLTTLCEEHPTLVRRLPAPVPKIIGDLSNRERVVVDLRLQPDAPR